MAAIHDAGLGFRGELRATLIHPDGSHLDLGLLDANEVSIPKWRRVFNSLKRHGHLPLGMTFAAFLAIALADNPLMPFLVGTVTTAAANYTAADFLAASTARINAFNWHDSGTGTAAASIANTALQTPTGQARVAGIQSNPAVGRYRTQASITYAGPYAISEWSLSSAATAGTLWDRRRFAAKPVVATSTIAWMYDLTVNAGG